MARFRGTIRGQRGDASRLGSINSGLVVTCNGWDVGVRVVAGVRNGKDHFQIYATGGSNSGKRTEYLGEVTADAKRVLFESAGDCI